MTKKQQNLNPANLRRQLSVAYIHNGVSTMDDPNSYQGKEKKAREDSLLVHQPRTGYADGIRNKRQYRSVFFKPYTDADEFFEGLINPIVIPIVLSVHSIVCLML